MNRVTSIVCVVCCVSLMGCASQDNDVQERNVSTGAKKNIVTSFYPLAFITKMIVGDHADVINLAGSQEVHDYVLSPEDLKMLYNADLVIYMGSDLESWAGDVIPQLERNNIKILNITQNMTLFASGEDAHEHETFDPHVWTNPVYAQEIVKKIMMAVTEIDSTNTEVYNINGQMAINQFHAIDQEYVEGLKNCMRRQAIVSHEAFGYIARQYDLELHAIVGISTMDEPSSQLLAELKEVAQKEGITHVLAERNSVQRFAQTVAQTTGLDMLIIYSLEQESSDVQKTYYAMMRDNLHQLRVALACE